MHRVYDLPRRSRRGGGSRQNFISRNPSASKSRGRRTGNHPLIHSSLHIPVLYPARLRSNHRPLDDNHGSRDTRALFVVSHGEPSRDVLRICTEAVPWPMGASTARWCRLAVPTRIYWKGGGHGSSKSRTVREEMAVQHYVLRRRAPRLWPGLILRNVVMSVLKGVNKK
jgi:hypothetical protein